MIGCTTRSWRYVCVGRGEYACGVDVICVIVSMC